MNKSDVCLHVETFLEMFVETAGGEVSLMVLLPTPTPVLPRPVLWVVLEVHHHGAEHPGSQINKCFKSEI